MNKQHWEKIARRRYQTSVANLSPAELQAVLAEVVMEQTMALHCPQHVVLMPDESGMLCVFQNRYGDALALVKELDLLLTELPDNVQQAVRHGKGFDTIEALEKWLEGSDS